MIVIFTLTSRLIPINAWSNFSKAIEVAIKELAPDKLIVLGPGATLGGAVAQIFIEHESINLTSKADFIAQPIKHPFYL